MSSDVERVPLSELAEINPRKNVRINEDSTPVSFIPMGDVSESGRWVRRQTRPLGEVNSGYTSFKEGDVLFAKITPCMENGKGCHARELVNGVGFGSTEFHVLRAREGADARFIYHWTQSPVLRLKAESAMSGSAGQQRVKTWFFEEFKVPNLPLSEQRRIAAVLDTVDAAIRETDAVIAKQEQVKTGLLQDLLTRGLDADGHLRDPARHPEQFQESPLGLIPREWSAERLANVADLQVGFAFKSSWFREDKGIRLLRGTNVGYGCPDWSDTKLLPYSKYEEFKEYELNEGDIIIGMDRPFTKQGFKVSTLYSHDVPSLLVQRVGRFRSGDLDDRYLRGLLRTSIYKRSLLSEQQGMDIPHISKTDILNPVLPIPPRAEQKRIGKILTGHEEKSESESAYRFKLVKLKTGLMQDLLTGRKRVPEIEAQVAEAVA